MANPYNRHPPFGSMGDKLQAMADAGKKMLGQSTTVGAAFEFGEYVLKTPRLSPAERSDLERTLAPDFGPVRIDEQPTIKRPMESIGNGP